jgi:Fe-Mn family superoxide dismutase
MKEVSRREDHMHNAPAGQPLFVLDMYEHAYHSNYGAAAAKYVDTRQCGAE